MKINIFPSSEQFCIRDCVIAGTQCKLIFPNQIGIKWDEENKIFRSSIWTNDGELVSASFKKFTNLGEQPEFEPLDENGNVEFVHKLDGSTLIISKFKNELIVRTRGTIDAKSLPNGFEIDPLKEKYTRLFNNNLLNSEKYSFICEWYSPSNIIVEREHSEPKIWLTAIIRHEDYSYLSQKEVDQIAEHCGIERPKRYHFDTIEEMTAAVKNWKTGEGIVIYGNSGQVLKKTKADRYLFLHRIKSHLNNEKNLIEFYVDKEMPPMEKFYSIIESEFDYEIAKQLKKQIEKICEAGEKTKKYIDNMLEIVHDLRNLENRKKQAEFIIKNYKQNSSYVFSILDGKKINNDQLIKLVTKNYES